MIEEMLAARGICVTHETVRQWETPTSGAGLIWTVFDEFEAAVERRVEKEAGEPSRAVEATHSASTTRSIGSQIGQDVIEPRSAR